MHSEPIQFFLPCTEQQFERLPKATSEYLAWQSSEQELDPFTGRYHWVLQTYLQLRAVGANVSLHRELPEQGIIVSHLDCFEYGLKPNSRQFIVVLLVDRESPHPRAQLHVTHNPVQRLPTFMPSYFMRPWPQIGLVPRDMARGGKFENVYFVGNSWNLDPALASEDFRSKLAAIGLRLHIQPAGQWHDFSDADCILAIRNFGRPNGMLNRPSIKLYNAWLAQVPIIVGHEPGCQAEGRRGIDYLEATDPDEAHAQLLAMRANPEMRRALVAAGLQRARRVHVTQLQHDWLQLINEELIPRYRSWRNASTTERWAWQAAGAVRERLFWRFPNRYVVKRAGNSVNEEQGFE